MPAVADVGVNPLVAVQAAASIHSRGAAAAAAVAAGGVQAAVAVAGAVPAAPQPKQDTTPSKPVAVAAPVASDVEDRTGVVARRQLRWRQEAAGEGAQSGGGGGGDGYKPRVVDL